MASCLLPVEPDNYKEIEGEERGEEKTKIKKKGKSSQDLLFLLGRWADVAGSPSALLQ